MWVLNEKYSLKRLDANLASMNSELVACLLQFPLNRNVWLEGQAGAGKSHLARAVGNRYEYRGKNAEWMSGPEFRAIGEMWPDDRNDAITRLASAKLLVIDDIDKCLWTPKALESAWYLMECRYKNNFRTVVTANCSGQAMKDIWSQIPGANPSHAVATLDRFQPCDGFVVKSLGSLRRRDVATQVAPKPVELASHQEVAETRRILAQVGAV